MNNQNRFGPQYPEKVKVRACSLREQGFTLSETVDQLAIEFPESGTRLRETRSEGRGTISTWTHRADPPAKWAPNNKIDLEAAELGIIEQFRLVPHTTVSDKFAQLTQGIPELLAEKRKELGEIQEQIRQLEQMSAVLGEEIEEESELASVAA